MLDYDITTTVCLTVLILIVLFLIFNSICMNNLQQENMRNVSTLNTNSTVTREMYHPELKKAMEEQYKNDRINSNTTKQSASTKPSGLRDAPEKGIVKLCVYHMENCGACMAMMKEKTSNGKTVFENVKSAFANNKNVKVLEFKIGRDKEASKYQAFPTIMVITENGSTEYNRQRTPDAIINYVKSHQ